MGVAGLSRGRGRPRSLGEGVNVPGTWRWARGLLVGGEAESGEQGLDGESGAAEEGEDEDGAKDVEQQGEEGEEGGAPALQLVGGGGANPDGDQAQDEGDEPGGACQRRVEGGKVDEATTWAKASARKVWVKRPARARTRPAP